MTNSLKTILTGFFLFLFLATPLALQAKETEEEPVQEKEPILSISKAESCTLFADSDSQDQSLGLIDTSMTSTQVFETRESETLDAADFNDPDPESQQQDALEKETEADSDFSEEADSDLKTESQDENENENEIHEADQPDSFPESDAASSYGWQEDGSYLSAFDGKPVKGFLILNDVLYYFKEDGSKAVNETLAVDGKIYRFDENGQVIKGFIQNEGDGHHYYSQYDGHLTEGIKAYDGDLYLLNIPEPIPGPFEYESSGNLYCLQPDGTLAHNELAEVNGALRYFDQNGLQAKGREVNLNGERLYLSSKDGALVSKEEYQIRQMAQDVINLVGEDLHALFNWEVDAMSYQKDIFTKTREEYALKAFSEHQGNCFAYAAMYYYLADQLGYQARYINSWVKFYNGNSSGHGWVMIREGEKEFIYDPEAQDELSQSGKYNFFKEDPWNPLFDYVYPDGLEPPQGCAHPYL